MKNDYSELGLRVGLEIHIQLDTVHKLFCNCPAKLDDTGVEAVFERELRPAQSELGEVDVAALFEWKRKRSFLYKAPLQSTCLVESDEEPPHEINREALVIALAIAKALNMSIPDEIHVMRKIVIDGSNTTGFQRTAIIAMNGYLIDGDKRIGIETLCLEEDAARKISESGNVVEYKLDRLGIPLLEITTSPDITSPEQAERVAYKIGQLVRLTGRAKRGLGTIRQDLNVSIKNGAKVEIKGVQHLYLISKVIEYEVMRQERLIWIKNELYRRGLKPSDIRLDIRDVTKIFLNTKSKILRKAIDESKNVYAILLTGFKGLLGLELQPNRRFGTELADYARVWSGISGLFHTDELPSYGITQDEVNELYRELGGDPERDAIIIVAEQYEKALEAFKVIVDRIRQAFYGVPEETRAANPDGTTKYMRPRPSGARMYPETDIPPLEITNDLLIEADKYVPESFDIKYKRFVEEYGLSPELASTVLNDIRLDLFEKLVVKYRDKVSPSIIASTITNTLRMLRKENIPVENIDDHHIEETIQLVAENKVAKEAIPEILAELAKNPDKKAIEIAREKNLISISIDDLEKIVAKIIEESKERLLEKRDRAFNIVMGEVMKIARGRVDGKIVADIVRKKLYEYFG
uniref:Glutamyl-tRNA(Gln) amidotransferase subunit E n=1 Tax=Staphylothermus marinus TaxID=2280 RepID=A0A7C4HAP7_STAMA